MFSFQLQGKGGHANTGRDLAKNSAGKKGDVKIKFGNIQTTQPTKWGCEIKIGDHSNRRVITGRNGIK